MNTGQLILISAPSGAGKTSLVKAALEQDPRLVVCVSHTTRAKRPGETDGVNYHFVSNAAFNAMIAEDAFLEYAQVFDHQYGTAKSQVAALVDQGKDVILEIDWQGAAQVQKILPGAIGIFILPPSVEVLAQRLTARGQDSPEVIQRRLAEAQLEMSKAPDYDFIVVNDNFATALTDILSIIRAMRLRATAQTRDNSAVKAILSAP
jgi:guanylate kinase